MTGRHLRPMQFCGSFSYIGEYLLAELKTNPVPIESVAGQARVAKAGRRQSDESCCLAM